MTGSKALLRDISDTARWVAVYRARETERPDAAFRDPFARKLAGDRGEQIAATMKFARNDLWPWTTRTYLFDLFVSQCLSQGADMVINLAAGLDARPYRMDLPANLRWIEVDLPGLIEYKTKALASEKPRCRLERVAMDLSDVAARHQLLVRLGREASKAVVITEGLVIYLSDDDVGALATELASHSGIRHWVTDLASPGLLRIMEKKINSPLRQAGMPLRFAPTEGPAFFDKFGWRDVDVRSSLKTAAQLKRLPWFLRLIAMLNRSHRPTSPSRPWGGVCLFERS